MIQFKLQRCYHRVSDWSLCMFWNSRIFMVNSIKMMEHITCVCSLLEVFNMPIVHVLSWIMNKCILNICLYIKHMNNQFFVYFGELVYLLCIHITLIVIFVSWRSWRDTGSLLPYWFFTITFVLDIYLKYLGFLRSSKDIYRKEKRKGGGKENKNETKRPL